MENIVEGLRKRELKRAIDIYANDRKIEFTDKKKVLKTSLFDTEKNEMIGFDIPYKGFFNKGLISVFLVDATKFEVYESKTVNDFLNKLKVSGGISNASHIFVTENNNTIIQHSLQHVFDNLIGLKTPRWEQEYRACLASLIYADSPNNVFSKMMDYVDPTLSEIEYGFFKSNFKNIVFKDGVEQFEPSYIAVLKLVCDLDN